MLQITTERFFKIGLFTFLVIGVCNLVLFFERFKLGNFWSNSASGAGVFFNFVTAGFFYWLLKQTSITVKDSGINAQEIEAEAASLLK